ncbi:MAG: sodium:calcium antiporter [Dehalococcoidia bacterium]|nr:sodium:calcium antiporter [Dehalococcoidia bacterium]
MALELALVTVSLVIILIAAELFTNAVEWFGHRLGLAEGAVGSVLAAVGTAMPETMIPIIAILVTGTEGGHEIGIGAILGAPFLLSTAAFAVTGLGVIFFAGRRANGKNMHLDSVVIGRDIGYFFIVYVFAIAASFLPVQEGKYAVAFVLLGLYALYVYRTFSHDSGSVEVHDEEELAGLKFHRWVGGKDSPPTLFIMLQFAAALGIMIAGALLFVENLESVAHRLGVPALPLALVIAPLASELPEKFNSIIWVSQGKDTLAMGNISGAMVFQSCIPVAIGLLFTEWVLSETALVSAAIALGSTGIVYLSIKKRGYLSSFVLARAGFLWIGFVIYVVAKLLIEGSTDTAAH